MHKDELQTKYNQFARWYDFGEAVPEALAVRKLRRELLQKASGEILETAVGTGKNLPYYRRTCHITAIDLSPGMRASRRRFFGIFWAMKAVGQHESQPLRTAAL